MITIALSKGRIMDETLPLLAKVGLSVRPKDINDNRLLVWQTQGELAGESVRLILVRASDVPVYVRYGAADAGIAGFDILKEQEMEGLHYSLDLGIARCRLALAAINEFDEEKLHSGARLRVATKYPKVTHAFFSKRGIHADIIKLYGSMELAPVLGLADVIVDLVSTGNTLRSNGLKEIATIAEISSYLITNPAAGKLKYSPMRALVEGMENAILQKQTLVP